MNTMTDAATLSGLLKKRFPKKSGIVALCRCCVIRRVRRPRIRQARSEPISALPRPIQVADRPYFQPNWPAYPTKMTAEK